jgi:hypothetical protein
MASLEGTPSTPWSWCDTGDRWGRPARRFLRGRRPEVDELFDVRVGGAALTVMLDGLGFA